MTPYFSLNNTSLYSKLIADPSELRSILAPFKKSQVIVIDEIQKVPLLLDEIQALIENYGIKFLLTGSSARSLKRNNANMLGGRAQYVRFYPLSFSEIPNFEQFILMELQTYSSYNLKRAEINFWRSIDKHEVDFVINGKIAIEVKSTKRVSDSHERIKSYQRRR